MTEQNDSFAAVVAELRKRYDGDMHILWLADRIERLDAEMRERVQKYRERLEVTGHYVMDKDTEQLVRVDNAPDVDEKFDGIYCRDTTIKVLSEEITNLRARLAACQTIANDWRDSARYCDDDYGDCLRDMADAIDAATRASVPKDAATGDEGNGAP